MAEILVLGLTHFPALADTDEMMTGFIPAMLRNPQIDGAMRDPANWPAVMRAEWGEDEGRAAAARHRVELVDWMRRTRAALDDFAPDLVVMFGDDQYENFLEDCVPAYCVNAHPGYSYHPPRRNVWGEPEGTVFQVPGNQPAGKALATSLLNDGFDTAYSYKSLHHELGHAFANAVMFLDYDRKGFDYPILPISINSYGNKVICQKGGFPDFSNQLAAGDLDPPAPQPWRLFDLGKSIARHFAASDLKVALVASSGWSHGFLIPKNHYIIPDVAADRQLYDRLKAGDYQAWRDYPLEDMVAAGQHEVLNWMCLAGSLEELGRGPGETVFIESWIFNSSKVFLISPSTEA